MAARDQMAAEIDTVVGWLLELDLPPNRVHSGILEPVERFLLTHYGYEAGHRLNAEFVEVFERFGMKLLAQTTEDAYSHDSQSVHSHDGQFAHEHDGQSVHAHDGQFAHERDGQADIC